jgi:hypothetical protein
VPLQGSVCDELARMGQAEYLGCEPIKRHASFPENRLTRQETLLR